ncbi:hypothetical protein LIER_20521 [Lithospermum erythrorhizon]|uniref:Uncharacterized protein n=1 Tax=Lithospermum erythrorhizon TaxID=34254 RepID=A0AAV3QP51_LITER
MVERRRPWRRIVQLHLELEKGRGLRILTSVWSDMTRLFSHMRSNGSPPPHLDLSLVSLGTGSGSHSVASHSMSTHPATTGGTGSTGSRTRRTTPIPPRSSGSDSSTDELTSSDTTGNDVSPTRVRGGDRPLSLVAEKRWRGSTTARCSSEVSRFFMK